MRKYILILAAILLTACTKKDSAKKALKNAGYHPIDVGGYSWFGCGKDDFFATKFKAYSFDSSQIVQGCVCEGIFKGKTIRLN